MPNLPPPKPIPSPVLILPKHPGYILNVEYPGGKEAKTPIDKVPFEQQYYISADRKTATPITRVEARFSPDNRKLLEITEYGADGKVLRRTYGAQ